MAFTLKGPEVLAPYTQVHNGGSFWYNPPIVVRFGAQRFAICVDRPVGSGTGSASTHNLKAFQRDSLGNWSFVAQGPYVSNGFSAVSTAGPVQIINNNYVPGSGVLEVSSTAGFPVPPFEVRCFPTGTGPQGEFYNRLQVTAVTDGTHFAVTGIGGWDFAAPIGADVWQISISNAFFHPFACPTVIPHPDDPTNKILVAYADFYDASLNLVDFGLIASSFSNIVQGGPQVWGIDNTAGGTDASNDDTGAKTAVAYRASDNTLVFNYQGPPETVGGKQYQRPYFVTYDRGSATWGTPAMLAGSGEAKHYLAHGIVVDSTGETHCTVVKPTNGAGSTAYEIWHVAVDTGGTINTPDLVTNNVLRQREPYVGYPTLRTHGATQEIIIPYINNDATPKAAVSRGDTGTAPSWSAETMSTSTSDGPLGDSLLGVSIGINESDNSPYAFWIGYDFASPNFDPFLELAVGGDPGSGWTLSRLWTGDGNVDFLDRNHAGNLVGNGFFVCTFEYIPDGVTDNVGYFEYTGAEVSGVFRPPEYIKRRFA